MLPVSSFILWLQVEHDGHSHATVGVLWVMETSFSTKFVPNWDTRWKN